MNKMYLSKPPRIDPKKIVFLDSEKTYPIGENNERRWMELAIIDGTGDLIYHSYFDPGVLVENRFAKKGLTDEILMLAPSFDSQWCQIKQHIEGKHVVAWWADMEKTFFPDQLACAKKIHCAQARFSPLVSDYSMQFGNYISIGMWDAYDMLRLTPIPGHRHRAFTDVRAMLRIWNWLEITQPVNLLNALVRNQ